MVGGTYPMKGVPLNLNYNELDEHASPRFAGEPKNLESVARLKAFADPQTGEVAVEHLPTGFLMIDIKVFFMLNVASRLMPFRNDLTSSQETSAATVRTFW